MNVVANILCRAKNDMNYLNHDNLCIQLSFTWNEKFNYFLFCLLNFKVVHAYLHNNTLELIVNQNAFVSYMYFFLSSILVNYVFSPNSDLKVPIDKNLG